MSKRSKIIGIVVASSIILVFILALIYSISLENTNPFHTNRTGRARILYENVMSMDKNLNYPRTAEEVMDMQAEILMLLYGDFIIDDSLFSEVIMQQRLILGSELLELNSFYDQYNNFMSYLITLREDNIRLISIEVMPIIYDPFNSNLGVARVTQNFSVLGRINWVYYLQRSNTDNNWRIIGWSLSDEDFSSIN